MKNWNSIPDETRIEVCLLQIDIADHSKLPGSDTSLQRAKTLFYEQISGISDSRQGKQLNWGGDGGAFMFLTNKGEGFTNSAFSAIQMLSNMALINQEIAIRTDLQLDLHVRISCHVANVSYARIHGLITAGDLNAFLKNERSLGLRDVVIITEPVLKQLPMRLQSQFAPYKKSDEIGCMTYSHGWPRFATSPGAPSMLHHVSLPVSNLDDSQEFYRRFLSIDPLPQAPSVLQRPTGTFERPPFDFRGAWFVLPGGQHLHLVEVAPGQGNFRTSEEIIPRDSHFALRVEDFKAAKARLMEMGRKFVHDPLSMGYSQLYFLDDDLHVVEVNADM